MLPREVCQRGHPRTPENIYEYRGKRLCRECRREADARHRQGVPLAHERDIADTKYCRKCGVHRPLSEYSKNSSNKNGIVSTCKSCAAALTRAWDDRNFSADPKAYRVNTMLSSARARADRLGIPFALTAQDVPTPDKCLVLGVQLDYGRKGALTANSPSLDRIVPEKGYVPGNIAVISMRANTIKHNATVDELEAVAAYVRFFG